MIGNQSLVALFIVAALLPPSFRRAIRVVKRTGMSFAVVRGLDSDDVVLASVVFHWATFGRRSPPAPVR